MRYLLDSDVLISAKSVYYKPGFCQAFWRWLDDSQAANLICSIDKVRDELCKGDDDDPLVQWAKEKEAAAFRVPTVSLFDLLDLMAYGTFSLRSPFQRSL